MADQSARNDLELEVNMPLQRKSWALQRIAWVIALILLILIALGITGDGPLANAEQSDEAGRLELHYARFARANAPTTAHLVINPEPGTSEVQLQVSQDLLDRYRLEQISPEPDSVDLEPGRQVMTFPVSSAEGQLEITLRLEPRGPGIPTIRLGLVGGPDLEARQLVYP